MLVQELFVDFKNQNRTAWEQVNDNGAGIFAQNHGKLLVDFIRDYLAYFLVLNEAIENGLVGINHEKRALDFIVGPLAEHKAVIIID